MLLFCNTNAKLQTLGRLLNFEWSFYEAWLQRFQPSIYNDWIWVLRLWKHCFERSQCAFPLISRQESKLVTRILTLWGRPETKQSHLCEAFFRRKCEKHQVLLWASDLHFQSSQGLGQSKPERGLKRSKHMKVELRLFYHYLYVIADQLLRYQHP